MTVKHTPTPWESDDGAITSVEAGAAICTVLQADDFPCVDDDDRAATQAECEANAAFIVRAVNSHRPMVEALKFVRGALYENDHVEDDVIKAINAALAKAAE